ncbi:sensor histidine kinase [Sphingobium sp. SCG-1]|uniref:sensor histidine kinase n=1 Tax=Sphingobium sp. SCG-1 TaxID=2072936 RepID=UPI000CD69137|nr:histidine kinase [Sphingobium sp. SCG-1]AUW57412.1 sensor histidine kinase [Sphingobium sp. SCG-1]
MTFQLDEEERGIPPIVALYSILGFWLFYMALVTLRSFVMGFDAQAPMAIRRSIVTVIGIVVTWGLYLIIRRFDQASLHRRTLAAFTAAIPCAVLIAVANYYVFYFYDPAGIFPDLPKEKLVAEQGYALKEIAEFAIGRYFFLSAWAALYLAFSYAAEVRRVERRAAQLEKAAQQAELRSLRYQVNPHFLFNTLNSLSSLVMVDRRDEAEQMIMSLSNFYRASLTGDPLEDVPLSEEVHLQKLYLDIEAVRFPERLRTLIDIPSHVMNCCVPGLILQPLVENAIKYGVARTPRPVTIAIFAREEDDMLMVSVRNDGDVLPEDHDRGSGIGLANVRDRLAARFGASGKIHARSLDGGGYLVELTLPIVRRGC